MSGPTPRAIPTRRVDELLEMAATENDPEKRKALYTEFQQIVAEEVPIYFLNAVPMHTFYSRQGRQRADGHLGVNLAHGQGLAERLILH